MLREETPYLPSHALRLEKDTKDYATRTTPINPDRNLKLRVIEISKNKGQEGLEDSSWWVNQHARKKERCKSTDIIMQFQSVTVDDFPCILNFSQSQLWGCDSWRCFTLPSFSSFPDSTGDEYHLVHISADELSEHAPATPPTTVITRKRNSTTRTNGSRESEDSPTGTLRYEILASLQSFMGSGSVYM